jgi:hypothetical protein
MSEEAVERSSQAVARSSIPEYRWMKVGPDTGSRPTNESHLNGGVPRLGLLPGPHASPGLGASAFAPLLTTLNPYDWTIPPGFSGSVDVGLSFSPEKTQIELACVVAARFGVRLPGGPITSLPKAALALAPARAAVQTAAASIDLLRICSSFPKCGNALVTLTGRLLARTRRFVTILGRFVTQLNFGSAREEFVALRRTRREQPPRRVSSPRWSASNERSGEMTQSLNSTMPSSWS